MSIGVETESSVNKVESMEEKVESFIRFVSSPVVIVESREMVLPESDGKTSNSSSDPVAELYKIISSGIVKDVICSSAETGLLIFCSANSFSANSAETVLKQASNQII